MPEYTAFFYGTLMHPKILKRVIASDGSHLTLCPAILLDYTRHKVKHQDYPGVLSLNRGRNLFKRDLTQEERSVRGTLVTGLTEEDIDALDVYEGSEYTRDVVQAHPLGAFQDISIHSINHDALPSHPPPIPATAELLPAIEAETYVYCDESNLAAELWSYEDFVDKNAWKWHGDAADENEDITEVDRRRANGHKERGQ